MLTSPICSAASVGTVVEADVVVIGIGVIPNTEWLEGSGLAIDNGVVCDATMLAAPGITAAGDVARWPNGRFDEVMRIEHWDNAIEQGIHAAERLLVDDADALPFEACRAIEARRMQRAPSFSRAGARGHRISRRCTPNSPTTPRAWCGSS